ncbi:MAG: hypothetical protein ABIH67_02955 [Candidatus Uhrbacteria bacterium]
MEGIKFENGNLKGLAQEIQKRQRIPYGELKLLGLIALLVAGVLIMFWAMILCRQDHAQLWWWFPVQGISLLGCLTPFGICLFRMIESKWFSRFWHNNVFTDHAVFWFDTNKKLCCTIVKGNDIFFSQKTKWILVFPLGGRWSKRGRFIGNHENMARIASLNRRTRIQLHSVSSSVGIDVVMVRWSDGQGDSVTLQIERAMQMLQEFVFDGAPVRDTWSVIVPYYYICLSEADRKLQLMVDREHGFIHQCETLKLSRDATIARLDRLTHELADTSRFGKSKEGLQLRQELERDLLALAPEDWSRRPYFEIAVARQQHGPSGGQQIEATQVE